MKRAWGPTIPRSPLSSTTWPNYSRPSNGLGRLGGRDWPGPCANPCPPRRDRTPVVQMACIQPGSPRCNPSAPPPGPDPLSVSKWRLGKRHRRMVYAGLRILRKVLKLRHLPRWNRTTTMAGEPEPESAPGPARRPRSRLRRRFILMRHPDCRPLKHCRWCYGWTGLDHPKLLAAGVDEDVKAWTQRKCERARTVCVNRVDS